MSTTLTTPTVNTVDTETRKQRLAQAIANSVRAGWSVESQSDHQAVMVKHAQQTNHILHLILTLLTLGLWAIIWIALAILHKGEQHQVITVDEYGNTSIQR
jgi:Na+-transporting NADH:ubiquinone oxidoreductase subunit NqrC